MYPNVKHWYFIITSVLYVVYWKEAYGHLIHWLTDSVKLFVTEELKWMTICALTTTAQGVKVWGHHRIFQSQLYEHCVNVRSYDVYFDRRFIYYGICSDDMTSVGCSTDWEQICKYEDLCCIEHWFLSLIWALRNGYD